MADRAADNRSPDEIRRDIEGTRADMHETVDALERKLSPGQLLDEVWGRVRSGSGDAGSAVGDIIRDHPIPLALMGLGVAWLAIEKGTDSDNERLRKRHGGSVGTYERAEGRLGPYRGDAVSSDGPSKLDAAKGRAGSVLDEAQRKASDAVDSLKAKASDAKDSIKSSLRSESDHAASEGGLDDGHDMRDRVHAATDRAREEASYRGRQLKRGFWSAMEEQPLAMGAVAFGLGLASGLAAPSTRLEDRVMGDAADSLKDEAKTVAREAGESAQRVAADTARAAKREADRQNIAGNLEESVRNVAAEAKSAAKRSAREEELDSEGMKDRAAEMGRRTRNGLQG